MIAEGQPAPDFELASDAGETVSLSGLRGQPVVLYFYPKDDTPGCTREACAFRDGFARFQQAGLTVLGCSVDSSDAHRAFIKKYKLPFPLLLDPDRKIAKAYGAANGIPILGLDRRITYVIDENGKIAKVYPSVDPSTHAGQIIADLHLEQPPTAAAPFVAAPAASPTPEDNYED